MGAPLIPQRINIPIGGGLAQNETPEYLDSPALFACENMYHRQRTDLTKRPGYNCNQICVDGRKATITSWLSTGPNTPLVNTPADRFLKTETGCTFVARGWLWSYVNDLFNGCTGVTPIPNAIRHCEIPDLHVSVQTTFGIADTNIQSGLQIIDAASSTHVTDLECSTFLLCNLSGIYEWHVRLTCRSTGNLIIAQTLLTVSGATLGHVCCAAYPDGFIVTCFNVATSTILCFRYTLETAQFTQQTFPALTLHDPQGWQTTTPSPIWYDLCGTTSNDVHIGWIVASGSYTQNIHSYPDISYTNVTNGLFAATLDASTMTIKYGGYYMGQNAVRQIGCLTYAPIFSVAGDDNGNYAVAWIDTVSGNVYMSAAYQQTPWVSPVVLDSVSTYGIQVGIGFIQPDKQVDVMWGVVWEYTDTSLPAGGNYLTSVKSKTVGSTGAFIYVTRNYWASHIISNPWCALGNCYAVMATSQPLLANMASSPSGATYADQPFVLARIWCDQDTNDTDAGSKNYQYPMAVWGYGEVKLPTQPARILWDPESSSRSAKVKGNGSIVISDPFLQSFGVAVQRLEFDPTSPDRYSSAPLPGGGSIFGCANPWIFDGDRAFEASFVQRPWFLAYAVSSGGTLIDDTTVAGSAHYLQLIFEHQDAKGRFTRSPASQIVSVSTTGPSEKISITVVPPFWSARAPGTTVLKIYMCRDGISFQLVGNVPVAVWQVGLHPTPLAFLIGAEPASSPFIYTYDGTIESGYAPFASHVCRWDNRIWLIDENQISYSQQFIDGDGPSFPDSFTEYIDTKVTGIVPFDDRLVLFNMDAVAYRSGEGPLQNGQGSNYTKWNYFTHEVGCVNSRSIVRTQVGTFFQSRRHIEFLDTSCKITHQLAVEILFSGTSDLISGSVIVGGLSLPKNHQVRLLYYDQTTNVLKQLVIDYETMTWSVWYGAYPWVAAPQVFFGDIGLDGDNVYVIDGYGEIFSEIEYLFEDTNVPIASAATRRHIDWNVTTPWIKLDGLQGVQMVWNSMVMFRTAEWESPAIAQVPQFGITVSVDVDYQGQFEVHGAKTIQELNDLREPSDSTYLQIGHINPICSAYQIQLSSNDSTDYDYLATVTGVYGIVGLWSELAIQPGTGRKSAESRM